MMDALKQRGGCARYARGRALTAAPGLAAENVNVGHDSELRARVAGAVAGRGGGGDSEDDWPVAFSPAGTAIGGLDELARYFAALPAAAAAARQPESTQAARENAQNLLAEREAAEARLEQARRGSDGTGLHSLEDSLHVLDMRLSVLGDQFRPAGKRLTFPYLEANGSGAYDDDDMGDGGDDGDPAFFGPGSDTPSVTIRAPASSASSTGSTGLPLRTVDVALEGLEWAVVKGYGWVHSMVSSPQPAATTASAAAAPGATGAARTSGASVQKGNVTLANDNNNTTTNNSSSNNSNDDDDGDARELEFEVVQTNWYGRQQKRLLRVTAGELLRVHPMTGDVRKRVLLQDITSIIVTRDRASLRIVINGDVANADVYLSLYVRQLLDAIVARQRSVRIIEGG